MTIGKYFLLVLAVILLVGFGFSVISRAIDRRVGRMGQVEPRKREEVSPWIADNDRRD